MFFPLLIEKDHFIRCWDVIIKIRMADIRQWSQALQAEWDFASWLMKKGWHDSGHSLGNIWLSPSLMMELYSQACQRYPEEDKRDEFFETETSKERKNEVHHFSWLHTKMCKLFWQMNTNTYKLLWPAESHLRCLCQGMHVSVCVCVCVCVSDSMNCRTVDCRAPLSIGFSRQEYRNGLPCPPPGDLPNPGIEPRSPALQVDSLPLEPLPHLKKLLPSPSS